MTNQPHSPAEYNGRFIDESSKPIQSTNTNVSITSHYIKSWRDFMQEIRDKYNIK